jgi:hypothetical protein
MAAAAPEEKQHEGTAAAATFAQGFIQPPTTASLRYHGKATGPGAQTNRLDDAVPVRNLLGG